MAYPKTLIIAVTVTIAFASSNQRCEAQASRGQSETFPGIKVRIASVRNPSGFDQRVIVTSPARVSRALPSVFVVGWLSCDSIEMPKGPGSDGFLRLLHDLIIKSGMTVVRVEKPGLAGNSPKKCEETDFQTELDGYRSAFESALDFPEVDRERLFVLGLSNGAGVAPLVAGKHDVKGYVAVSGWARTWAEHMIDLERRRLTLGGQSPEQITPAMRGFVSFYEAYLNRGLTPSEVEENLPSLKGLWYDAPEHQYGRPASFYHQLQNLDLMSAWGEVRDPVLIIHGELDWIMSDADVAPIAVTPVGSGRRELAQLPGFSHTLSRFSSAEDAFRDRNPTVDDRANAIVLGWLSAQLAEIH